MDAWAQRSTACGWPQAQMAAPPHPPPGGHPLRAARGGRNNPGRRWCSGPPLKPRRHALASACRLGAGAAAAAAGRCRAFPGGTAAQRQSPSPQQQQGDAGSCQAKQQCNGKPLPHTRRPRVTSLGRQGGAGRYQLASRARRSAGSPLHGAGGLLRCAVTHSIALGGWLLAPAAPASENEREGRRHVCVARARPAERQGSSGKQCGHHARLSSASPVPLILISFGLVPITGCSHPKPRPPPPPRLLLLLLLGPWQRPYQACCTSRSTAAAACHRSQLTSCICPLGPVLQRSPWCCRDELPRPSAAAAARRRLQGLWQWAHASRHPCRQTEHPWPSEAARRTRRG